MADSAAPHANHQTHIWGGFLVGILTVLVVAVLYFLFRRKLLPALRRRQEQRQFFTQKHALKGEEKFT